jgi:CubicO group peptidase (beta-lactamase class C family)
MLADAPPREDLDAFTGQLEAIVPGLIDDSPASGVAIGLVRNGRTVWTAGFGTADRERGTPVTARTAFQVASISTALTAWGAMRLVEEGRLDLDRSVAPQLARLSLEPPGPVSLRQLLSHTSGLPEHQCLELDDQPTVRSCVSGTGGGEPLRFEAAPGSRFEYSNANFMLAQELIGRAGGASFPEVMRRMVLRPLGMSDITGFDWGRSAGPALATGYDEFGMPVTPIARADPGASGLASDVRDMSRFVAALSPVPGATAGRRVLSQRSRSS